MLSVKEQARAIYNALEHDAGLTYVTSALSLVAEADQIAQRVRLPGDSLSAGGSADCIDGGVLFASLLELASIEPVVVVAPGHAFVGWRVWRGAAQYQFLETTLIGSAEFDEVCWKAETRYEDVVDKGYLTRGVFDPGGFARLIDVVAHRAQGIHELQ